MTIEENQATFGKGTRFIDCDIAILKIILFGVASITAHIKYILRITDLITEVPVKDFCISLRNMTSHCEEIDMEWLY